MLSILACSLPFPLCSRCVVLKYAFISQFKAVFSGFLLLDVGLYCLRALRGLCGFCVRERLGGFGACGVFAPVFHLLPLVLSFCPAFLLSVFLSLFVLFACLVCSCVLVAFVVVSLSLTDYTQKERAQSVVPCVLSCPVMCVALSGCCFVFLVLVRCQPVYIVIKF